jgi:hypothetical protein
MATKTATVIPATAVPVAAKTAKTEGLALLTPLRTEADRLIGISGIYTADEYLSADALFGRIKQARKTWKDRMERIIRPIRLGLDELYSLNREVDAPLAKLEDAVERKMVAYKQEERRQLQAAENERLQREQAEQRRLAEIAAKEERAKTDAMRAKLAEQRQAVEERLAEQAAEPQPEAVSGFHSSLRTKKVPKVANNLGFIGGVAEGVIPADCITINMVRLRAYYKDDPETVASFPGVVIVDDDSIAGR